MSEYRNGLVSMLHSNLVAYECALNASAKLTNNSIDDFAAQTLERARFQVLHEMSRILEKLEKD